MAELISWILLLMTFIFIIYWIITYLFLKIGFYLKVGIGTLEFFRLLLKPLFLINFFWFLIAEIVFSLIYWTKLLLFSVLNFISPVIIFLNSLHPNEYSIYMWIFYSFIIYTVVMIPYFTLQYKLSFYFKRTIFHKLAASFNAKEVNFLGQSFGISINQQLYKQLAAKDKETKDFVTKSIKDYSSNPGNEDWRFSIQMRSTDHMSWEVNKIKADFFEAVIEFRGEEKDETDEGKPKYITKLNKELFDGIVIFIENIFENTWMPTIFEVEQTYSLKKTKNRKIHKQNFLIKLYNDLVFNSIATNTAVNHNYSKIEQYFAPEMLKVKTNSLFQYIVCDENNIYLLLKTDLDSTAFDFNMNISVKDSIELFRQDLTLVSSAIGEIELILKSLEKYNIKYAESAA
jgi:hypothetical protein